MNTQIEENYETKDNSYCVTLEHIGVTFKNNAKILRDINLNIKKGEFVSLIGRSGCGKTTLLKVISGLIKPDSGTINVTQHQAIGFQDARLIPWITVSKNVVFGMQGNKSELKSIAEKALNDMQLNNCGSKWPSELSGGQAQRVSLARALVHNPELLLLDEPFGALDALTRLDMQDLLDNLRQKHGWTTIMVTHDISEAVRLSDRILMIKDGIIEKNWNIDRSQLDAQKRPNNHVEIEDELREALQ
ncbi:ABC transporter ATP-binding protein [Bifidobacteriaceae bacterium NR019]|uniref:ABC transporter ATP-binding protein n=2 Tax=Gardnerella TaxID=2701 RepID=A0AAP8IU84_GARVA|nr:ABC transporter ATP-binding protein [Gardnerella sp. 30-4]MDK7084741.1 ABC transporter ATP-binding protein [Gardnerella leopoldii]PKZ18292.1 ABC transporter ATP-binding protein [Gardnerella vaginalis]RFT34174.1 ABC transporter ATP-binding protein [Bifidobacteriaceae bacterium NR017]RFT34705.1 ABC transporter ATP-binding protein [Bifidobacteriaceae bacterium NR019]PKZ19443.1 ABC transporter ATP-binding protein [Gardnerella vaginalis]